MNLAVHKELIYVVLALIFLCVMSYLFLYTTRSRNREHKIEGNQRPASKEAGILEAQESMKRERQQKHG